MTLRTITFDDSIYKLVPREPIYNQLAAMREIERGNDWSESMAAAYSAGIAAAPEYQEPQNKFAMFKDNGGEWQVIQDIGKDE